jgi:hypothetical protein
MKNIFVTLFIPILIIVTPCTPAESIIPTTTPEPTVTPLPTPTPVPTTTPLPPVAMVGGKLHCFEEPNLEANMVTIIDIGMQVEVIGHSHDNLFWLVKPDEEADSCWLEARYATVINLDNQEIAKIQPTPTATLEPLTLPQAPENFSVESSCKFELHRNPNYTYTRYFPTFILNWELVNRVNGYLIFRDGNLIKEVDASIVELIDILEVRGKGVYSYVYAIQAFNEIGESEKVVISASASCFR